MNSIIENMQVGGAGQVPGKVHAVSGDGESQGLRGSSNRGRLERLRALTSGGGNELIMFVIVTLLLLAGWNKRGDVYLSPEEGLGYALGITGGVMMLSLLIYPLRKHVRWARVLGKVRYWFRLHMVLGIAGPVCILYHCNFQLGSLNGNVALFCMLLVASSGLVGRYFYTRIHYGLYGRKADLEHLTSDTAAVRGCMKYIFDESPELQEKLEALEAKTRQMPHSFLGSLAHVFQISILSHWHALGSGGELRRAINAIKTRDRLEGKTLESLKEISVFYMRTYFVAIRRVAGLSFYERLFSLWHVLHFPLFIMLVITGFVHVIAVHMY